MLTWHGVADRIIPTNNSIRYYSDVREQDPRIEDFYRLFLAPGVGHCGGAPGFYPVGRLRPAGTLGRKGCPADQIVWRQPRD